MQWFPRQVSDAAASLAAHNKRESAVSVGRVHVAKVLSQGLAHGRIRALLIPRSEKPMSQFDNVSVIKKANIYFDGKCVSHTVLLADGTRKSVGVILPATLTFTTSGPEVMELLGGRARVRLAGEQTWTDYAGATRFSVPANSHFDIEVLEAVDYVCHFG